MPQRQGAMNETSADLMSPGTK